VTIRSGEARLVVERGRIAKVGTVRAVAGHGGVGHGRGLSGAVALLDIHLLGAPGCASVRRPSPR
jgi:hypothetical protein